MPKRAIAFEAPGKFVVYAHTSPVAHYPEEHHSGLQVCIPFHGARYVARRQSSSGKALVDELGGRDVLVIPAGQPHAIDWLAQADVVSFILSPGYLDTVFEDEEVDLGDGFVLRDAFVTMIAGELRRAVCSDGYSPLALESLVNLLLHRTRVATPARARRVKEPQAATSFSPRRLEAIREFVADNLSADLSLKVLADQAGMSVSHFSRRLRTTVNLPPQAFVTDLRMTRACELLARSRLPVSEIAAAVGMTPSHFTRVFTARFGKTPTEHRRDEA